MSGGTVAGHRLIEKIGEGHFGEVWKASYQGGLWALKLFTRPYRIAGLRREALAQYALGNLPPPDGRFFPRVDQIDLQHQPPFVRMELVEGAPLEQAIGDPSMGLPARLELGRQILEALAVVHARGFVHGDLSPLNILVARRSGNGAAAIQLIDVGFGALLDDDGDDPAHSDAAPAAERPFGVASPLYAAPERFKSDFLDGCGKASDLFSYGKILYRLVTGESPYIVKPITRKYPHLGEAWDEFVFRCLEERPEERFADAPAALAAFERLGRPAARPSGELRTECPECDVRIWLGAASVGERLACPGCGVSIEILGVSDSGGFADAAVVSKAERPVEEGVVVVEEARKFCPNCGERVEVAAAQCRLCGVWVGEFARSLQEKARARVRQAERDRSERTSYVVPALFSLLMYFPFWLPGAILNLHFLAEAARTEKLLGERPAGATMLQVMIWTLVYMPLIFLASVVVFGVLGSVA